MTNLGATDIITSVYAGQILYSATPSLNKRVVTPFLKRVGLNLSEITLQVAIVTVTMTEDQQRGFDWDAFSIGIDTSNTLPADTYSNMAGSGGSLDALYARTGYPILGTEAALTINAAIDYLSTLGRTEAEQNVELRTLAGQEVTISDGGKTVYNSGYDIVTTDNISREVAQPAEVSTGLTLSITPNFDAESGLVTCEVALDKTSLEELRQYGTGASTVEYPVTNNNNLQDIVRMRAGETVIIGGVVTSAYIDNRTAPVSMWDVASSDLRDSRKVLFIIMRPSVTIFELDGNEVSQGVVDAHKTPTTITSDDDMFLPVTRLISNRETEAKDKAEKAKQKLDKAMDTIDTKPIVPQPPRPEPEPQPAQVPPAQSFAPSTEGGLFDELIGRIKSDTDTP